MAKSATNSVAITVLPTTDASPADHDDDFEELDGGSGGAQLNEAAHAGPPSFELINTITEGATSMVDGADKARIVANTLQGDRLTHEHGEAQHGELYMLESDPEPKRQCCNTPKGRYSPHAEECCNRRSKNRRCCDTPRGSSAHAEGCYSGGKRKKEK